MKKMSKMGKSILLSSLAIIAFGGIAAGTTYALFTSDATTNVSVSTGKVKVSQTVAVKENSYFSPKAINTDGTTKDDNNAATSTGFANGGSAVVNTDGSVKISKMTAGDSVTLKVIPENESNVNIQYRESYSITDDASGKLTVSGNEKMVKYWTSLDTSESIDEYEVTIALSGDATEDITDAVIKLKIEAVQGNAYVVNKVGATEAEVADAIKNAPANSTIEIASEEPLTLTNTLSIKKDMKIVLAGNVTAPNDKTAFDVTSGTLTIEDGSSSDETNKNVKPAKKFSQTDEADSSSAVISSTGYAIEASGTGKVVINGGSIKSTSKYGAVRAKNGGSIEINGGSIKNEVGDALRVTDKGTITVNGGTFEAKESCAVVYKDASLTVNGGTFTSYQNFVIGTDGTQGETDYTITINDGTFNAYTDLSSDSIACGVYAANKGNVFLFGGTFNVTDGCGVLARSGNVTFTDDVAFNFLTDNETLKEGKVCDSKVLVPVKQAFVQDNISGYPGGDPSVSFKLDPITMTFASKKYKVHYIGGANKANLKTVASEDELKEAVSSSTDSLYIKLSNDIEISQRLDVIAPNCTIDLNGHTVTMKAGNTTGQAFNVIGVNATINNGFIDGTAITQVKSEVKSNENECDPIVARKNDNNVAANVTLANLNVTINSNTGACAYSHPGGNIKIISGTYTNNNTETYKHNESFTALTLNQENDGTDQLITVTGGTFVGTDPSRGDEHNTNVTSFLYSGTKYKATSTIDGNKHIVSLSKNA